MVPSCGSSNMEKDDGRQWGADHEAPSAVKLKRTAASSEMGNVRDPQPVDLVGIEVPPHVENGTSIMQSCTCAFHRTKPMTAGLSVSDAVRMMEIIDYPGRVLPQLQPTL